MIQPNWFGQIAFQVLKLLAAMDVERGCSRLIRDSVDC